MDRRRPRREHATRARADPDVGRIRTPQFRTAAPRTPPGRRSVHGGLRSLRSGALTALPLGPWRYSAHRGSRNRGTRGRGRNSEDTAPNECRKELHRILDHKLHKSTPVRDGPTEVTVRESNTHGTIVGARSHFRAHGVPGGTASRRSHSSLSTSIAMAARLR